MFATGLITHRAGARTFLLAALLLPVLAFAAEPPTLTNLWTVDIQESGDSTPAIDSAGTLYFGTFSGNLWALNPDGTRKWLFKAGREIKSSPALGADGTVYFGSRNRKLHAVESNGREKWSFKTGAWVDASPALGNDGTIYFGSWDTNFYALAPDGSRKWQFPTGGPIVSSAAIDARGRILFGSHDGRFYALTPEGKAAWSSATGGPILSSPALDRDGTAHFTSVDGFLYAVNGDGTLKWKLRTGGITESSPVLLAGGEICLGVNQDIWVVDTEGKKKWQRASTWDMNERAADTSPVALANGSFCFISGYSWLMEVGMDQASRWLVFLKGHGHSSPAVGHDGTIYTDGHYREFYAYKGDSTLADSPWPTFRGNPRNTGNVLADHKASH